MNIVCISDTHGLHDQLELPSGDMLIHAGDISRRGTEYEVRQFLSWFEVQPFQYKIFIAGNHDFFFEDYPILVKEMIPENVIYLENSAVEIEGIRFWGSPISPRFFDWAFNRDRGPKIRQYWEQIPDKTDILITHGPPLHHGDTIISGEQVGCKDLLEVINEKRPTYHLFGHIHEAYGITKNKHTTFINASVLNHKYKMTNPPITIEVESSC